MTFSSISQIQTFSGTFTPSDSYLYLAQGMTISNAPNFLIVSCHGQLDMTLSFQKNAMAMPVMSVGFFSWILDPSNLVTGIYIDGRIAPNPGNTPMPQGLPVDYTVIIGQATIL